MAQAGMLAAVLLVPGCTDESEPTSLDPMEPLRRATFRAMAAHDFLASCPGGGARVESERQLYRLGELKQLASRKQAGRAIWLGENDWAGVARYSDRGTCEVEEEPYREALARFSGSLDTLASRIADYRE